MKLYAIYSFDREEGFIKELPSKANDGGEALLVFTSRRKAQDRAAQYFGYDRYSAVRNDGWCKVVEIGRGSFRVPKEGEP